MKVVYLNCRFFYKPMPSENLNFRRHFLFFRVIPLPYIKRLLVISVCLDGFSDGLKT